jgi:DNA (cytosine-5)-methyltransferase 1
LKTPKSILEKDGTEKTITTEKEMWEYLKGSKSILRVSKDGFKYNYSEGGMIYPDALDNASRTIITGEGGKSPSRFKHVIVSERGLRRLTPVELERLNMFPDNHTKMEGVTDTKRAFFMGNALVVGVIEKIGDELYKQINE